MKQNSLTGKSLNRRFLLLQSLLTLLECASTAYLSPIMVSMGYTAGRIGRIIALAALAAVLCRPIWGFLNDRYSCAKQVVFCACTVGTGCYYLLTHSTVVSLVALSVAGLHITILCMLNFVDSWALRLISAGYPLDYGGTRAGGSFSYAVGAVLLGVLITRCGFSAANIILWGFLALLLWVVAGIPNPPSEREAETKISLRQGIAVLARNPVYCLMLTAFFLSSLTSGAMESFYPVRILQMGGTEQIVGVALFIQAMSEIPIIAGYNRIRQKTKLSPAAFMGISMLFYGVKAFLTGTAASVPAAVAVSLLQALSYALFVPASIDFMLHTVQKEYLATAHLCFIAIGQGAAVVLGNLFWGTLADRMGLSRMFCFLALPALAAAVLAFYTGRIQKKTTAIKE